MKLLRIIGLLATALLLAACGVARLAYNQAPELLYWRLDSYVDFTDEQSPRAKEELAKFQQWHRSTQLPQYLALLQQVQQQLPAATDTAQVCAIWAQARSQVSAITAQIEPAAVWLALSMTPEQILTLERKHAKSNADWREQWLDLSPQALQKKRYEFFVKMAEWVYEPLQENQKAALRASLAGSAFDPQQAYAERLRQQQDQLATLRQVAGDKVSVAEAQVLLRGYFARTLSSPNAAYRAYQDQLRMNSCAHFAKLHNASTPAQRQQAGGKIRSYEADVRALMAQ